MKIKALALLLAVVFLGLSNNLTAQMSANSKSNMAKGGNSYSTGIGLRGGFASGVSIKHFVASNAALEGILGSRWRGLNLTGIYELHKRNALGVARLSWEYGIGGRVGFYDGRYYREWKDKKYYANRSYTVVSAVGLFGLEYQFGEVPFTLGVDIMPYFDFIGRGDGFMDGSVSFRYTF